MSLSECAKDEEKRHEENESQIERHPWFTDATSDKGTIPIV